MESSIEKLLYEGKSVRELVREAIDTTRTSLELSLLALVSGDESLSRVAIRAEKEVRTRELLVYIRNSLAVRNMSDALDSVSIFQLVKNLSRIADAAADISKAYLNFKPVRPRIFAIDGEEMIAKITYSRDKPAKLDQLLSRLGIIVNVVAIKKSGEWILEPPLNTILHRGEELVVKGSTFALKKFARMIGSELPKPGTTDHTAIGDFFELIRIVTVMFFLSLSALLMNADWLAENVMELEGLVDDLHADIQKKLLDENFDSRTKAALLFATFALERVSDSLTEIAATILEELEPHPILLEIFEETKERISVIEIDETDDGKTIEELGYHLKGVSVLAIKRGDTWLIMPPYSVFKLRAGDILIVKYFEESEKFVDQEEAREDREEIIEEIWEEEEEE